ncbi:MAG: APC family permease [Bifidobacteriaceae bacterium]|jgi:amino acid transporter|nr:APC family permease [Bifidobacteriaceae bacterium]
MENNSKIGLFSAVALTVGAMVGSAIFALSGVTIQQSGNAALISWVLAGVILFGYGIIAAFLAKKWPDSGGMYTFPEKALGGKTQDGEIDENVSRTVNIRGKFFGFLGAWTYLFGCVAGVSFSAIYLGYYSAMIFPALAEYATIISLAFLTIALVLNLLEIDIMSRIHTILTVSLIVILAIYIISTFLQPGFSIQGNVVGVNPLSEIASSIPIAILAYGSIVVPAFMSGAIKNPKKNVPLAMLISMSFTILLYFFTILSTLGFVSQTTLQENPSVAYSPLTAAVSAWGAPEIFVHLINIGAILALFTTLLVVMTLGAQSIKEPAKNALFPKVFAGKTGSNLAFYVMLLVVTLFYSSVQAIIESGALFNVIFIILIAASIIKVGTRWQKALGGAVSIALVACYIPEIVAGDEELWLTSAVYLTFGLLIFIFMRFSEKNKRYT